MKEEISKIYGFNVVDIEKNEESTDGNVYMIKGKNEKYVMKVYDSLDQANIMINIHNALSELYIPRIVKTSDSEEYIKLEDKYGVIYSFLKGTQICDFDYNELIPQIAKEVRKMHDTVNSNLFDIKPVPYDVDNNLRSSILHFDLTKNNIFYNDGTIGFIDFDDAKFGPAICDVAILIPLLFMSKKRGVNTEGIKTFIDNYYKDGEEIKEQELAHLKEYALNWVNYLLNTVNFDSSLKESFSAKKKMIQEYL